MLKMFEMTHRSLLSSKKFLKASTAIDLFNYSGASCFSRTYHTSYEQQVTDVMLRDILENDRERDYSN